MLGADVPRSVMRRPIVSVARCVEMVCVYRAAVVIKIVAVDKCVSGISAGKSLLSHWETQRNLETVKASELDTGIESEKEKLSNFF